jgi:hypothetical protein
LHALFPAFDDATGANGEAKRLAAFARAVELLALVIRLAGVVQPTGVMHDRLLSGGNTLACTFRHIALLQLGDWRRGFSRRCRRRLRCFFTASRCQERSGCEN